MTAAAGGVPAGLTEVTVWIVDHAPLLGAVIAVGVLVAVAGRRGWRRWQHARAWTGAARVEILAPPAVDPTGAVAFWQHLLGLLPPRHRPWAAPHVVFGYEFSDRGLAITMWVPGTVPASLVAAAARSAWPGTRTTTTPTTRPPTTRRHPRRRRATTAGEPAAVGGRLRLARPAGLPIATEHRADPIRALIGAAGPLDARETVQIQILARPLSAARFGATTRRRHRRTAGIVAGALSALAGLAATLVQEIVATAVHGPAHRTTRARPGPASTPGPAGRADRLADSAQDRATAAKTAGSGGGYAVAIRYLATTQPTGTGHDDQRIARAMATRRARAVASAFAEFSGHNHFHRRALRHPAETMQQRILHAGDVLSVAELAALAHLPTDAHVPGLRRAGATAVAPPPAIPDTGPGVRPLGESDLVSGRAVGLSIPDARHHLWIIGATGAGKSSLCAHGVLYDAHAGRAAIVIDPKGDLVTDITARLPDHACRRLIVIDPDHPPPGGWPCLNPLDPPSLGGHTGAVGDVAVENVVSVFSRVFTSGWGHRTEDLLRVACLTLRAGPGPASLAQIPDLLTDPPTRRRATHALDPSGRLARFWAWYEQLPDSARAQIAAPLLNKLRAILLRPFADHLLCRASTIDLARLLDTGGLLLIRLPKGVLGEDTVRLLGSLIVAQVWQAALARARQPEYLRRDASLLLDECQNFLHLPYRIEDLLAEARGYRLSLTLAHQHLAQLTPALREGIGTNARNKILFATSPDDAAILARHTLPELGAHDLAHLDRFHAAARLLTDGADTRAFTLTTRPLPPAPHRPPAPGPASAGRRRDGPANDGASTDPPARRPVPTRPVNSPGAAPQPPAEPPRVPDQAGHSAIQGRSRGIPNSARS